MRVFLTNVTFVYALSLKLLFEHLSRKYETVWTNNPIVKHYMSR